MTFLSLKVNLQSFILCWWRVLPPQVSHCLFLHKLLIGRCFGLGITFGPSPDSIVLSDGSLLGPDTV